MIVKGRSLTCRVDWAPREGRIPLRILWTEERRSSLEMASNSLESSPILLLLPPPPHDPFSSVIFLTQNPINCGKKKVIIWHCLAYLCVYVSGRWSSITIASLFSLHPRSRWNFASTLLLTSLLFCVISILNPQLPCKLTKVGSTFFVHNKCPYYLLFKCHF